MKRSMQILIIISAYVMIFFVSIRRFTFHDLSNMIVFIFFLNIVVAFQILASKKISDTKMFWILIILFLPLLGIVFYYLFGESYFRTRRYRSMPRLDQKRFKEIQGKTNYPVLFKHRFRNELDFIRLIDTLTNSPIHFNCRTEVLTNGEIKFERLLEKLKEAEKYIHIEYFIIHNGEIADEIADVLIEKANAGVEVRLLFDDIGSIDLTKAYKQRLLAAGVEMQFYNPVTFRMMHDAVNYRNHRKIVVIDGIYGFTGGINIGDEYLHKDPYYGFWRDTHIMIEGEAVRSLNLVFLSDWFNVTREDLLEDKYLEVKPINNIGVSGIQIISDGPDIKGSRLKDIFFKAIMEAQHNIRISTPYLIPEADILKAIKVAAFSGVQVDILVPGKPDLHKNLVYLATQSYFESLLEAGCNIYTYDDRFMHSKVLIIDEKIASVGTANLDFRSFHLNFEVTALLYLDDSIKHLIKDFKEDLKYSTKIEYAQWKKRSYYKRWFEAFASLFSPML